MMKQLQKTIGSIEINTDDNGDDYCIFPIENKGVIEMSLKIQAVLTALFELSDASNLPIDKKNELEIFLRSYLISSSKEIHKLQKDNQELVEALRASEFDSQGYCPCCGGWGDRFGDTKGVHTESCIVKEALKKSEETNNEVS